LLAWVGVAETAPFAGSDRTQIKLLNRKQNSQKKAQDTKDNAN
jgi:hypothetical protein